MKNSVRFSLCWAGLFLSCTILIFLALQGVNFFSDSAYSSAKKDALMSANDLMPVKQLSKNDLLIESNLIWQGEKIEKVDWAWQKELLTKADSILRDRNLGLYILRSKYNFLFCWLLLIIVFCVLIWSSKIEVPPEYEYVYQWAGEVIAPLKVGYNYVFPYFGLLKGRAKIPMNVQTLSILSGVRDGLSDSVVKEYIYGTASNIEPDGGDAIRALYQVEFQCIDSLKLFYAKSNPYKYIAKIIEFKVSAYLKNPTKEDTEGLSDHFLAKDWDAEVLDGRGVLDSVREEILDLIGINLIHFVPVDLIFAPNIIVAREKRALEKQRGLLLEEQSANMDKEAEIAKKRNKINGAEIDEIIQRANVSGSEALNHIIKDRTLESITQASKTGNITYIDGSGNGNFAGGAGFGWGLNATNNKSVSEKKSSDNSEEKKSDDKEEKKSDNKKSKK